MGELKILGAQRVKALQKILEGKEKEALNALPKLSDKEASEYADIQLIGEENIKEYNRLTEQLAPLQKLVNSTRHKTEWYNKRNEYLKPNNEKRIEVKKEFDDKKNSLWLCETMEEAKEIVGI